MKIIYIVNARIPTEKAHGLQIVKMCEAFANLGHDVELVVPRRKNTIKDDVFNYYGVARNFKIRYLPVVPLLSIGRSGFYLSAISFAISAFFYCVFKRADIFYFRDEISLALLSPFKNTVIETHDIPESFIQLYYFLIRRAGHVVSTNEWKKNIFIKYGGIAENKISVFPNGIDPQDFFGGDNKTEIRRRLNLPQNKKLVIYVGHLYEWKGAGVLAEAAVSLSPDDTEVLFVGGTAKEISEFRNKHVGGKFVNISQLAHQEAVYYIKAADVLVLPNIPVTKESEFGTSPIKMFEYMASGNPIVASDLPSIREILNDKNAMLVEAGNARALALGIEKISKDVDFANNIADQALRDVTSYTWDKRAAGIISFLKI